MNLSNTQLFRGLEEAEITSLFGLPECHNAQFSKRRGNPFRRKHHGKYRDLAVRPGGDLLQRYLGQYQYFGSCCARLCIRRGVCLHSGGADVGYGVRCGGYIHIVYECGACPDYLYQCLSIPHKTCPKSADCLRSQKPSAFSKNPAYQFQIHSGAVDVLFFGMRQTRREQFFPDPLQPPTVS